MGFLSNLFAKLFGGSMDSKSGANMAEALREFITNGLPKSYVQSPKYALSIQEMAGGYVAHVMLDMLADGSDYADMDGQDLRNVAELESGYLLGSCLSKPPADTSYNLGMDFSDGHIITVERRAGAQTGILTDHGQRQEIHF